MHIDGRVAVVTGAASGIGLAVVEALVEAGARVAMADIDVTGLEQAHARLTAAGADVDAHPLDVTDPDAVDRVAHDIVSRWGSLSIAVNNAGVVGGGPSWEIPLAEWRRIIDIDLWGVVHCVRSFVPHILATGDEGHVVNVASMAAFMTIPEVGPYTAAKAGVLAVSEVLRAELAERGVGVSAVLPGPIDTKMVPGAPIAPSAVARNVIDAIRRDRAYVFTDEFFAADMDARLATISAARREIVP